jgi:hypothetical protein
MQTPDAASGVGVQIGLDITTGPLNLVLPGEDQEELQEVFTPMQLGAEPAPPPYAYGWGMQYRGVFSPDSGHMGLGGHMHGSVSLYKGLGLVGRAGLNVVQVGASNGETLFGIGSPYLDGGLQVRHGEGKAFYAMVCSEYDVWLSPGKTEPWVGGIVGLSVGFLP